MILTIDPGLRGCGCAAWSSGGELMRAAYVPARLSGKGWATERLVRETAWAVELWMNTCNDLLDGVVIERPQTYRGRSTKGDANDLLDVSLVVGALSIMSTCSLQLVRPSEWKGQTPKAATEARAKKKLGERAVRVDLSCGKVLASNVWDAVGIGLWYFRQAAVVQAIETEK